MIKCTRKIEFDAGHRVIGHNNKCQFLHGHRYVLEVTAEAPELDHLGMVVDFGLLKKIIKKWVDDNLDHTLILSIEDEMYGKQVFEWTGQNVYYLKNNPTAENIALHLKNDILPKIFKSALFQITAIKLWETPNCFVEV